VAARFGNDESRYARILRTDASHEKPHFMAYIPIEDAIAACRAAGNTVVPGKAPILGPLKRDPKELWRSARGVSQIQALGGRIPCGPRPGAP
jgi:hypothetical protein